MDSGFPSSDLSHNLRVLERRIRGLKVDLAQVDKLIAKQRQIIVDLEQSGQDAEIAKILLREAEEDRAVYVSDLARLERRRTAYQTFHKPTVDTDKDDKGNG